MIRAATLGDAAGIARVHVRAWQHGYGEVLDPASMEDLSIEAVTPRWRRAFDDPATKVWVFEAEGAVVGVAALHESELTDLYVDPTAQGAGVGTALLDMAVAEGARELCVFVANERARSFYEHQGWSECGPAEPWRGNPAVRYRLAAP